MVANRADLHAVQLATKLGRALRDARQAARLTQAQVATRAGLAQSTWSRLEMDADSSFTLATWDRAAFAVGGSLDAFVRGASAADQPRDAVHLRHQELILRTAVAGGWVGLPEEPIDRDVGRSRWGDVLLHRRHPTPARPDEYALVEVIDWFDDVGAPMRDWQRRVDALERYAIARMPAGSERVPRVGGCWVLRATQRNRRLIGEHRLIFRARFPGSGRAWLAALNSTTTAMPQQPSLLWVSVSGDRLFPGRLAGAATADPGLRGSTRQAPRREP